MLPDAPDSGVKLKAIFECGTDCAPEDAPNARYIVAWVAEKLGLTAIHAARCKEEWPGPEGSLDEADKKQAGYAALRRRFQDLAPASRREDESAILSYSMLHGPCDNYCLRDVIRGGLVVGQRCRMHAELKAEHCCRCPRCVPASAADGEMRCEPCDDSCPPAQPAQTHSCKSCATLVWMLPGTFRFELRVCRRHPRLQVHLHALSAAHHALGHTLRTH